MPPLPTVSLAIVLPPPPRARYRHASKLKVCCECPCARFMLATTNYDLDEIQVNQMFLRPLASFCLLVFSLFRVAR